MKKDSKASKKAPKIKLKILDSREQVKGEVCICLSRKFKHQSFCDDCVMELPRHLIFTLGDSWEDGFEEHYLRARDWLIDNCLKFKTVAEEPTLALEMNGEDSNSIGPAPGIQTDECKDTESVGESGSGPRSS